MRAPKNMLKIIDFRQTFFTLQSKIDRLDLNLHLMLKHLKENEDIIKNSGIYWDEVLSQNRHFINLLEEINRTIEESLKEKIEAIP
ncbi:MAG: hypothetical protein J7K23_00930 [Thermoproteales archaeon]|nr:hypothetical protein [Thermoproteales archaeon]